MINIYSKESCPQCQVAIALAKAKGIEFTVLKLGVDYTKEELLKIAPNARTVPQIFQDNEIIGDLKDFQRYLVSP